MHQPIYSPSQILLLLELEANKAKSLAWVAEDPENRWTGYHTTDLDHWAEYSIFTVEQYNRFNITTDISELHKEIYGVKLRTNFDLWTTAELEKEYESLERQFDDHAKVEAERETNSISEFEAAVSRLITEQDVDRATVIKWLMDAEDAQENDYFCYCNDLPYGYIDKDILKEAA